MTAVAEPRSIDTVADVVTEQTWDRPTNAREVAASRKGTVELKTVPTTYRVAHRSIECSRVKLGTVVELDVPLASREAGMPCDYCWPLPDAPTKTTVEEAIDLPDLPEGGASEARARSAYDEPSPAQVDYWRSLRTDFWALAISSTSTPVETHRDAVAKLVAEEERTLREKGLWKRGKGFSDLIDDAKADLLTERARRNGEQAKAAKRDDGIVLDGRPNRYGGDCARCGSYVAEGSGLLGKRGGNWVAVHRDGDCVTKTDEKFSTLPKAAPDAPVAEVPEGHYAIASTGKNDLAFYRVDRPADGKYAGRVFVKLIVGGRPGMNVKAANVPGILARIAEAGIDESGAMYGREIGRCCRCNRHLTDEESRSLGIGPECRKRSRG